MPPDLDERTVETVKPHPRSATAIAIAALLTLAACSSEDLSESSPNSTTETSAPVTGEAPTTTTSTVTEAPPTTEDQEAAVVAIVDEYNAAFERALANPSLGSSELVNVASAPLVARIQTRLDGYADTGAIGEGQIVSRFESVRINGIEAEVDQCQLDATFVLDRNGATILGADARASYIRTFLVLESHGWLVEREQLVEIDGQTQCEL